MDSYQNDPEVMLVDDDTNHENIISRCNPGFPIQRPRLMYNSELSDCYPEYPRGLLGQNAALLVESEPPYKPNTYRNQTSEFNYSQHDPSDMTLQYIDMTLPSHPMDSYSSQGGFQSIQTRTKSTLADSPEYKPSIRPETSGFQSDFKPIVLHNQPAGLSPRELSGDPYSNAATSFLPQSSTQGFHPLDRQTSGAFPSSLDRHATNNASRFQANAREFGGNQQPQDFAPIQQARDHNAQTTFFTQHETHHNADTFSAQLNKQDEHPLDAHGLNRSNDGRYASNSGPRGDNFALNDGKKGTNFALNGPRGVNVPQTGTQRNNIGFTPNMNRQSNERQVANPGHNAGFQGQANIQSNAREDEANQPAAKKFRSVPLPKHGDGNVMVIKSEKEVTKAEPFVMKILVAQVDLASVWYHNMRASSIRTTSFMFQVVGRLESIRAKSQRKTIIIKHTTQSTALQCVFYEIDRKFPPIAVGSVVM
uniref:Uncharacterized protein n=1 Tax=Cacopsylla melanoneura TaxID=428564 RepID=A0A8D9A1F4_9HEMI